MSKKILISVSYGASEEALAADIGCIEQAMQAAFPDWELRRAFTSGRVRALAARQGRPVPDPAEAVARAKADGAAQIAVAALLVSPGGEFESVEAAAQGLPVATPLLTDDGATVAAAVKYLPFAVAIPLVSVAAFLLDGVFVGATASRYMLFSAILSAAVFFGLFFALRDGMGNYALWTAFISFLFMRSLAMAIFFRPMVAKAFGTAGK